MVQGARTRWAAIGAAVAITFGAGGIGLLSATNPSDALTLVSITPCRVVDTRPVPHNVGHNSSPLGAGEIQTISTVGEAGDCTQVPASAKAVSLNVTAVSASLPTFLTLWAAGEEQPKASSLNPVPDAPPTPNAVTTGLNTDGEFSIYNLQGTVDVIVDINGYYVDHTHDDRYYTKSQTRTQIEAAIDGDGGVGYGGSGPWPMPTYVPTSTFGAVVRVTTQTAGRLFVTAAFGGYRNCDVGFEWYYLLIDGDPIESSLIRHDRNTTPHQFIGVTETAYPAGDHNIALAIECSNPFSPAPTGGNLTQASANVLVIP